MPEPTQQQPAPPALSTEHARLAEDPSPTGPWRLWGPYLAGRQWGTVREDYSGDGDAWNSFGFDQSHRRAYRWGEDGLGGICDRFGFLNFAVALWNRRDPILKERLFGLTNAEGNHGEDAKEYWWVKDGTPSHSYMEWLYRYPHAEYPYRQLREVNAARGRDEREFELADTGILAEDRFFDVTMRYAKSSPTDITIAIDVTNHGPEAAGIDVLPQLWFRNTWSWGRDDRRASMRLLDGQPGSDPVIHTQHDFLGEYYLIAESAPAGSPGGESGSPRMLFCDNETNAVELFGAATNLSPFPKDGINRRVVEGELDAVNPANTGTKAAIWYSFDEIVPGQTVTVRLRLTAQAPGASPDGVSDQAPDQVSGEPEATEHFGATSDALFATRRAEADEFYAKVLENELDEVDRHVARRAYAGLLWGKQLYRYDVEEWLAGDPIGEPAPPERSDPGRRNTAWRHFSVADVISMPDEWEYPWFAAWDLAFHCLPLAHVDPEFAKEQLVLMCREWAMHPNGQLSAYEWEFGDVNPPVHAWAAWHVYRIDGRRDQEFLIRVFTKLLLNFSWWVNRKDADGSGVFEGGFLGMDNIGFFNRSAPLPAGFRLEQSDATSWMAFYCQQMFKIAIELSRHDSAWQDTATKFLEHFLTIARAMRSFGSHGISLWHEEDGFFYDQLVYPDGHSEPMRVKSMVGLLPILGATDVPTWIAQECPEVTSRLQWLQKRRPEWVDPLMISSGPEGEKMLLSLVSEDQLRRVLEVMFDTDEFLAPYGIRSLSKASNTSFTAPEAGGFQASISYEPGESGSGMFGGNSNWRGPVWFPVNVLLADKLRTLGNYFGDDFQIEVPTGSGNAMNLVEAAEVIEGGLQGLFRPIGGVRPSDGKRIESSASPLWAEHPTFSEYFDGDTGEGLGATHQTGWTGLVAHLHNPASVAEADRPADD